MRFHGAGRGIGHQVMCEEGFAWPGTVAVASGMIGQKLFFLTFCICH